MKRAFGIAQAFGRWIESVATTLVAMLDRFLTPRVIALIEDEHGEFVLRASGPTSPSIVAGERVRFAEGRIIGASSNDIGVVLAGSRVDLTLQPVRFLVQALELPRRAEEFLDGIVRSQIDQLTPWNAGELAFGWSRSVDSGSDRIAITVAATGVALIAPYVDTIAGLGARSIAVFTSLTGAGRTKILERAPAAALEIGRIRRVLVVVFLAGALAAVTSVAASSIIGARLDARQADLANLIASTRAAANSGRNGAMGSTAAALQLLEQRKHDAPSATIILDILSQILPDHTYVTELRIEQDKLQLTGVTRDAPSLIGLLERSGRFTRASFFAPTTRAHSESYELFHIETHIQASPRS